MLYNIKMLFFIVIMDGVMLDTLPLSLKLSIRENLGILLCEW